MLTRPGRNGDGDRVASSTRGRALPSAGSEDRFFLGDIRRGLQLHGRLARAIAIAGIVLAAIYCLSQAFFLYVWPGYMAQSIVYAPPKPSPVLEPGQGGSLRWPSDNINYESYIQQQMLEVSREPVLAGALHKLQGFQRPRESDQAAVQRLQQRLAVTREPSAYHFSIGARAGDPEMAAEIANAVTASYIESVKRGKLSSDTQRLTMLREVRDWIQNALLADRVEQDTVNQQLAMMPARARIPEQNEDEIAEIRTELAKARSDHDAAQARLASLDAGHLLSPAAIDVETDEMIAGDAGLASMRTELTTRRSALISQMTSLAVANPEFKEDGEELAKINGALDSMTKETRGKAGARIEADLHADLERTGDSEARLNAQLRQLAGAAAGAAPKVQRASDLAADISRLQSRFATVDDQLNSLMLEDSAPAAAYQVSPAVAEPSRGAAGVLFNASLIVFAGLLFGVLAAVISHKLDPGVYIGSEVEQVLGFQPMAQLPDFNDVSKAAAEEYILRLASAIEQGCQEGNLKSCIFTGAGSEAGVSMLVTRVWGMLQAMGRPTVLVDITGANPPAQRARSSGRDAMQGLVHAQRASRPGTLRAQTAAENDSADESLVLVDSAPLAVSAESEYLARFVDCVIVIVESGMTTRAELRETAAILQRLDVSVVGFVLNRVGLAKADPAFRVSVDAVERHVRTVGGNIPKRTQRRGSFAPERSLGREANQKDDSARKRFEPELAAAAAAVARFSPQAGSPPSPAPATEALNRLSSSAAVEAAGPLPRGTSPAPARTGQTERRKDGEPDQPAARPPSQMPAKPSATPARTELPRAPLLWQAAKAETDQRPPSISEPAAAGPSINPEPPRSWETATQTWESLRSLHQAPRAEAEPQEPLNAPPEDATPPLAARLSGLRNLLFTLGVQKAQGGEGVTLQELVSGPILEASLQPLTGRPAFERSSPPAAEETGLNASSGSSPRTDAAPEELLSPGPVVIEFDEFDEGDESAGESSTRQDRRSPVDPVDILPSKRGQYKKK